MAYPKTWATITIAPGPSNSLCGWMQLFVTLVWVDSRRLLAHISLLASSSRGDTAVCFCRFQTGGIKASVDFMSQLCPHCSFNTCSFCLCVSVSSACQRHLVQNVLVRRPQWERDTNTLIETEKQWGTVVMEGREWDGCKRKKKWFIVRQTLNCLNFYEVNIHPLYSHV